MNLLALDTSTEYLSLAVSRNDQTFTFNEMVGQSHSQRTLPQIDALLQQAGLSLQDCDGIVFGAGPGSFTGLRIACGIAQGLAFGANLPVIGISTLLAVAQQCYDAFGATKIIACLDARMQEIYHAVYEKTATGWIEHHPASLEKPNAVANVTGNGWVGAGSGWQAYGDALTEHYAGQMQASYAHLTPDAATMLKLAQPLFASGKTIPAAEATPLYVRNKVALTIAERAKLGAKA